MLFHTGGSVVLADLLCLKTTSEMERKGLGVGDSFASFTSKIDIYNLIPFTEV